MSEFTAEVELLAAVYDRIGHLTATLMAVNGVKRPPRLQPWPRPVTAIERARSRRARADFDDIVARALPHRDGEDVT